MVAILTVIIPGSNAMAAGDPAGTIRRMEGSVIIVRGGKTLKGIANTQIYPTDEIKTGPESMAELILQDGSSLHMGPDSRLELSRYKFSLTEDKPSFIAKMAKGLFVYISGAISKVHPGSVKFETPDATIGIRGTKLVVKIIEAGIGQSADGKTITVLFRDPTGNVGTVIISNTNGTQTLNKEYYAVTVNRDNAPSQQVLMDRETLEKMIPESLFPIVFENYTPPLPYTEREVPLGNLNLFNLQPPRAAPFSASSPAP